MTNPESIKPEQKDQRYYDELADELERLEKIANDGRGVQHIKYVISSLRQGRIDEAKADCFNQSDKFDSIPEIKNLIKTKLFEPGEKHPWSLFEKEN